MLQTQLGRVEVLFGTFQQGNTADVTAIDIMQYSGTLLHKIVKIEAISCILVEIVFFLKQIADCEIKFSSGHYGLYLTECTGQNKIVLAMTCWPILVSHTDMGVYTHICSTERLYQLTNINFQMHTSCFLYYYSC